MDVRNSLKFGVSAGNVYTQCNLESHKKNQQRRKKKELESSKKLIDGSPGSAREGDTDSRPP